MRVLGNRPGAERITDLGEKEMRQRIAGHLVRAALRERAGALPIAGLDQLFGLTERSAGVQPGCQ